MGLKELMTFETEEEKLARRHKEISEKALELKSRMTKEDLRHCQCELLIEMMWKIEDDISNFIKASIETGLEIEDDYEEAIKYIRNVLNEDEYYRANKDFFETFDKGFKLILKAIVNSKVSYRIKK